MVVKDGSRPLDFDLELGDADAYDHATVVREGFYSYFSEKQSISLQPNAAIPAALRAAPGVVATTEVPPVV
jgi:hypothetical protein